MRIRLFYSNLNMEEIKFADYMHAKNFCKNFEIKKLGDDMYLKSDPLILTDFFKNFR